MQQCQHSVPDCPADNDQAVPFNIQIRIAMHRHPRSTGRTRCENFNEGLLDRCNTLEVAALWTTRFGARTAPFTCTRTAKATHFRSRS